MHLKAFGIVSVDWERSFLNKHEESDGTERRVFLTVERTRVTLFCAHFPTICEAHTVKENTDALLVSTQIGPEMNAEKTTCSSFMNIMQAKITT
jgi:hypothetical protein